jgi:hypothetical protein
VKVVGSVVAVFIVETPPEGSGIFPNMMAICNCITYFKLRSLSNTALGVCDSVPDADKNQTVDRILFIE